ncbi:MFS transporter [Sphingomonas spermidinifaciens]|uniref:MFS transporter n=1 Tax=Sphingomonas spermidinifaciens TaxID=1141889 RepID=A0A2A4B2A9_9SPHN|nr:MFS transporter [Sphingomonas spermidinifaciens]PCD01868.1 MFS transporter [Sphingomonas spermidinifaciens]
MINALGLLKERRFLPLFVTQFLGAFNDNLFKTAMVLFATYQIFNDPAVESNFNALATGLSLLPFFFLSALSGQLADSYDKAGIIRLVKLAEVGIMMFGATGLIIAKHGYATPGIVMMLGAVLMLGIHSTFFGPIKYAILPQHLDEDQVLGGTGLVEAGTYLSILLGTVTAGWIGVEAAAALVIVVALVGLAAGRQVPSAPRVGPMLKLNWNPLTASWRLIRQTMHIRRLFLAICAISFFWTIGAVLIVVFPPLAKNVLTADERVASLMIAIFSIGVAVGSVIINSMLKSEISAKYSPISVIGMALFVVAFSIESRLWIPAPPGSLYNVWHFVSHPQSLIVLGTLMGIATTGGMFVVPLYAFLTTTVTKDQTARTVAANNVVNAGAMVVGAAAVIALTALGVGPADMLLVVAGMCLISAWIARRLHLACD